MGDIFRRETAKHPEPFTGERLTSSIGGQVQIEHYHRYLFARSLVDGLDVLDVASGEGYGSALLAQVARSVIGIEFSGSSVRTAASNFPRPNLRFVQGDARALPLRDACVDSVVSFETIEHFDRHDDFLHEIRRVLRADGSFIVSTPDRDVYSPAGQGANPYHVRELSLAEFSALLQSVFRHVQIVRQRALIGSALFAETGSTAPALVFDRRGDTHFEACVGLPRAPYLIAVASDRAPQALPPCLYIDRSDLDTEAAQCAVIVAQLRQAQAEAADARQSSAQAVEHAQQAAQQTELARQQAQSAERQAEQAGRQTERAERQAEQAGRQAEQAMQRAEQAVQRAEQAELQNEVLRRERDLLQGSMRTFLRSYLPRLRNHLFGQRP